MHRPPVPGQAGGCGGLADCRSRMLMRAHWSWRVSGGDAIERFSHHAAVPKARQRLIMVVLGTAVSPRREPHDA